MNEPTIAELKAEIEALKFRILSLEAQRVCHLGDYWRQDTRNDYRRRDDGWNRDDNEDGPIRWYGGCSDPDVRFR